MTDIVEQAARVTDGLLYGPEALVRPKGRDIAQALADAGLLAQSARTVPTRDEIVDVILDTHLFDGGTPIDTADAILELLAGQPTVEEVQEQWANYITNTTGSVGNNLTLESLVKALRAPHPPFGGPHKNKETK